MVNEYNRQNPEPPEPRPKRPAKGKPKGSTEARVAKKAKVVLDAVESTAESEPSKPHTRGRKTKQPSPSKPTGQSTEEAANPTTRRGRSKKADAGELLAKEEEAKLQDFEAKLDSFAVVSNENSQLRPSADAADIMSDLDVIEEAVRQAEQNDGELMGGAGGQGVCVSGLLG